MPLVECRVCGERKYLEATGACLSERCNPLVQDREASRDTLQIMRVGAESHPLVDVDPEQEITREPVVQLVEGEACPTCGQRVPKSGKMRQKEYRERRKR